MADLITTDLVRLDADLGADKYQVIRSLAAVVAAAGRAVDVDQISRAALAREASSATGFKDGIAIPHCRTIGVDAPVLVLARLAPPVDFGATDGPADLAFLIAAPADSDYTHLQILTKLARALVQEQFAAGLRAATTAAEAVAVVTVALAPEPVADPEDPEDSEAAEALSQVTRDEDSPTARAPLTR